MSELSDKALIVRKMQALYCIIPTREFFFFESPYVIFLGTIFTYDTITEYTITIDTTIRRTNDYISMTIRLLTYRYQL